MIPLQQGYTYRSLITLFPNREGTASALLSVLEDIFAILEATDSSYLCIQQKKPQFDAPKYRNHEIERHIDATGVQTIVSLVYTGESYSSWQTTTDSV